MCTVCVVKGHYPACDLGILAFQTVAVMLGLENG